MAAEQVGVEHNGDDEAQFAAERVTRQGLAWNAFLTVFKGTAAALSGSKAMLADALESASDIVVTLAVLMSLKFAKRPVDFDHPYGHGKIESVTAQGIGVILLLAGAGILYIAVVNIIDPPTEAPAAIALYAALITIVVKEILFRYTLKTGKRVDSPAVIANAWGHRSDAYSSVVTVAGIAGALIGFPILDPVAAGIVSLFIFRMGINILRESTYQLMDGIPDRHILHAISLASEKVEGVEHTHEIRGRRAGRHIWIDLTLEMDPELTLADSHRIAHDVKSSIQKGYPQIANIMIHINPHMHPHTHQHEI